MMHFLYVFLLVCLFGLPQNSFGAGGDDIKDVDFDTLRHCGELYTKALRQIYSEDLQDMLQHSVLSEAFKEKILTEIIRLDKARKTSTNKEEQEDLEKQQHILSTHLIARNMKLIFLRSKIYNIPGMSDADFVRELALSFYIKLPLYRKGEGVGKFVNAYSRYLSLNLIRKAKGKKNAVKITNQTDLPGAKLGGSGRSQNDLLANVARGTSKDLSGGYEFVEFQKKQSGIVSLSGLEGLDVLEVFEPLRLRLQNLLQKVPLLTEKQRTAYMLRLGIHPDYPDQRAINFYEVSAIMGVTYDASRQSFLKADAKVKDYLKLVKAEMSDFLDD